MQLITSFTLSGLCGVMIMIEMVAGSRLQLGDVLLFWKLALVIKCSSHDKVLLFMSSTQSIQML